MRLEQMITENDAVLEHVASEREKAALLAVSPHARRAIKLEILPQLEESVISVESAEELCADTKRAIEAAFSYKNALYTRLINHKGIEQGDGMFEKDLLLVMDEWLRRTKNHLEKDDDSESTKDSEKQEVEVTVKVDTSESSEDVALKDTDSGPKIEIDPEALFELGDVRL
jgi:hypothetical protein